MGVIGKKKEGLPFEEVSKLGYVNLFTSLAISVIVTIWAIYINSFVNSTAITGLISSGLTFISFLAYFAVIPLIEKSDKGKLYVSVLILTIISYVVFSINNNFSIFVVFAIILTILYAIRISTFGIIVKDKSGDRASSNEGIMYTFLNLGWIIGPLTAGFVLTTLGIKFVFLLAAILMSIAVVIIKIFGLNDKTISKKIHSNIFSNVKDYFKDKDRTFAYIISGGANSWWILIYLFIPLYIVDKGLPASYIGYFLFLIALPLILTEYKFSKIASRKGFKKIFLIGFFITIVLTSLCFFVEDKPYIVFGFLILSSFGMAMLEPTTEAYFLDILKKNEASRYFGIYSTTRDVGQFIAKVIPSLLILVLPFRYVFIVFGVYHLIMFIITLKIKEIVEKC